MYLLPESIRTDKTLALDKSWETRLSLVRHGRLKIDLANETDQQKLLMWLEMFGIAEANIPDNLTTAEYQRLLQYIILIFRTSGTKKSIELLAYVLGADSVNIVQDFESKYDGQINYYGNYRYDGGVSTRSFIIKLEVVGIDAENQNDFELKMNHFFGIFEPAWLWLKEINFI